MEWFLPKKGNGMISTWFRINFPNMAERFGLSNLRRSQEVWFWEFK